MTIFQFYRQGVVILIFPKGQIKETRNIVVAISQSASSLSFSLTNNFKIKKNNIIELISLMSHYYNYLIL